MNKENEKPGNDLSSEVLVEKVREFETAKRETASDDKQNTAKILRERFDVSAPMSDDEAKKAVWNRSRRGFLIGSATALIGVFGWRWMPDETKNNLLRRTFEFNEKVSQIFYRPPRPAPEFAKSQIGELRVNGGEGMSDDFNPENWTLRVGGLANRMDDLILTLNDIKSLPRTEMTTELKCIEGWSTVVNWAGVRFSDFAAKYLPKTKSGNPPDFQNRPEDLAQYVWMVTPDEGYYVGWDLPSILHPQTLLAYEMNGQPLTIEHGAPLRIASPTKYGIKQIKRIGRIEFTNERPSDYWAERGYDWYSGH